MRFIIYLFSIFLILSCGKEDFADGGIASLGSQENCKDSPLLGSWARNRGRISFFDDCSGIAQGNANIRGNECTVEFRWNNVTLQRGIIEFDIYSVNNLTPESDCFIKVDNPSRISCSYLISSFGNGQNLGGDCESFGSFSFQN